jgi:protein phosphatase
MGYQINYTVSCHTGNIREKNQDNFWCQGSFLEKDNEGLPKVLTGSVYNGVEPAFVVFDGLGGEEQGEVAAYLATKEFDSCYKKRLQEKKKDLKIFLKEASVAMNDSICSYAKENHIRSMGTTTAIIIFGKSEVVCCNLGDSRVYQLRKGALEQISKDHVTTYSQGRKAPLTQHLGIPETEFLLEPYMVKRAYEQGDRYLICSDGLTDMLGDEEIGRFLVEGEVEEAARELLEQALKRGGRDNITVIICEVNEYKSAFDKVKRLVKRIFGRTQ